MTKNLLSAVTVTTTSAGENVEHFENLTLQFIATGISSGNGVFTVDVSNNGSDWIAFNMLIDNVTNTNGQTLTRVASKTLSSNANVVVALDGFSWKCIRVKCTVTTDGSYTAILSGQIRR